MPTNVRVDDLKINKLTKAQYEAAVQGGAIGEYELSIITDASSVDSVNGKSGDVILTYNDVNALPDTTTINDLTTSTQQDALNSGINSNLVNQIGTNQTDISTINEKIPSVASTSNQLADKAFVNSSINNMAAFYITSDVLGNAFSTKAALDSGPYYFDGSIRTITINDYAIVIADETHNNGTSRYSYTGSQWSFQYLVNDTPFTQAQIDALNSGINSNLVTDYNNHIADTDIHVNVNDKTNWNNKVDKVNTANKVYGTDSNGNQTTYDKGTFGQVDDVQVDGTSVVNNKIANLGSMAGEDISDYYDKTTANSTFVNTNTSITGATKTKITYDSKGLVTAGDDLIESDIPNLHLSKIIDVTATATELNYVNGVTSSIQSQLDSKVSYNGNVGSSSQPVYVDSNGEATAISYTIEKSVPSNAVFTDTTYSDFIGADGVNAGTSGLVKAPAATDNTKYLKGDGTWATVDALPSQSGQNGKFLTTDGADASWVDIPSVDVDNITINKNNDDEIQSIGVINKNTSNNATNALYDWVGTLQEYKDQDIVNQHPEWICYITDDNEGRDEYPYQPDLFDFKWSDHILDNASWIRADDFSWYDGNIYTAAYNHLRNEFDITKPIESETISGVTVYFRTSDDGHKIVLADGEQDVINLYNTVGIAWYYILDISNKRFKLPRDNSNKDRVVIKFLQDGDRWARIYNDGWVEQGGRGSASFIVPMADTNYTAQSTAIRPNFENSYDCSSIASLTVNGFSCGGINVSQHIWFVAGRANTNYLKNISTQFETQHKYLYFYAGNFKREEVSNEIIENIATKTEVNTLLSTKANSVEVYTKTETDGLLTTMLNTLYPVGSVYIGTQSACPMAALISNSTWELVSSGRALWTGNGTNANTTIAAGLPNITGQWGANTDISASASRAFQIPPNAGAWGEVYGAFSKKNVKANMSHGFVLINPAPSTTATSWKTSGFNLDFDASKSNSVYGNSTTVQPPAYVVNVWRRTA